MAFEIKNTLHAVETYVQNLGLFSTVQIGEPKQALGQGLHAAIYMQSVSISLIYLGGDTRENHLVQLRIYRDMLAEYTDPQNNLETELASAVSKLMSNLLGDTDLESSVMSIDAAGMDGASMAATYGYIQLGGVMYRVVDIAIPLIVNGSATLVGTGV
jgi:TATA-box binding protein (TBP) (component of TFIID and TFIIIB)